MAMYKRILVPLDGSERAEAILPHAREQAKLNEAEVILLQVIEPDPVLMSERASQRSVQDAVASLAEDERRVESYLAAKASEMVAAGIKAKTAVAWGPIVNGIIAVAERENVDLIALASHGRSGLPRVFYGSVAAGLLQKVDRPLLLIRSRPTT